MLSSNHLVEEQYEDDSELDKFEEDGFLVHSDDEEEDKDNNACSL